MAHYNYQGISPIPGVAGGTINPYRVVKLSAADTFVVSDAIADLSVGVSGPTTLATGDQFPVQTDGVAMLTASAAISAGAEVMVTASGAGKISTLAGATARSIGQAQNAAAADGDVISVKLNLPTTLGPVAT